MSSTAAAEAKVPFLSIDPFCMRQFEKSKDPSSGYIDCDPAEFIKKVNEYYEGEVAKVNFIYQYFLTTTSASGDQPFFSFSPL